MYTGVAFLLVIAAARAQAPESRELTVGQRLEFAFDPAAPHPADVAGAAAFRCVPAASGPLTVLVESFFGDVLVRQLDAGNATLAEDDDGSDVSGNARLFLQGVAGQPLRLLVACKQPVTVASIEVRTGTLPAFTGPALESERVRFEAAGGQARLERGDKAGALASFARAGMRAFNNGENAAARAPHDQALRLAEELQDATTLGTIRIVLGSIAHRLGDPARAIPLVERGLTELPAEPKGQMHLLAESTLADCQRLLGHWSSAIDGTQRALVIARSTQDRANEASLTMQLANYQLALGDHPAARASHEQAVSLAESAGNVEILANELMAFGDYHAARRELREAAALYQRALDLSPSVNQRARGLGQLSSVRWDLGDLGNAIDGFREVLDLARELGDPNLEAIALASEGAVLQQLGDLTAARDRLEQALTQFAASSDPAHRTATLIELAEVLMDRGDEAGTQSVAASLQAIIDAAPAPAVVTDALSGLALIHGHRGELAQARQVCERRLVLARSTSDVGAEATALNDLAHLDLLAGEPVAARQRAQSAVDISRKSGTPDLWALATLAQADLQLGNLAAVQTEQQQAAAVIDRCGARSLDIEQASGLRSRGSMASWAEIGQDLAAGRAAAAPVAPLDVAAGSSAELAAARTADIETGFRDAAQWKGRGLLHGIAEHRRGARSAEALALRREHDQVLGDREAQMQRIAQAVRDGAPADELASLHATAETQRARAEELASRMRATAPADAALDLPSGVGFTDVRKDLLAEGGTLIEFAEGQRRLYAYVVDEDGIRFHDLGERAAIQDRVTAYVRQLSTPRPDALRTIAAQGRELHDLLLAPLLPASLPADSRLIIVPTAALAALPFDALVMAAPAEAKRWSDLTFVIDRCEVTYGPSTQVLDLLAQSEPRSQAGRALVLADPIYSGELDPEARTPRSSAIAALPRLPGTRGEALHIARYLLENWDPAHGTRVGPAPAASAAEDAAKASPARQRSGTRDAAAPPDSRRPAGEAPVAAPELPPDSAVLAGAASSLDDLQQQRSGSFDTPAVRLQFGADASPRVFEDNPRQYAVIHCAAHGVIDPDDPRRSGLALSPSGDDDGFLSTADVLNLDLDADIVVLSACQTARGSVRRGEGVQSMARAFLYAGARSVVASLWQVDDRETEQTMHDFYQGILEKAEKPAVALRAARLAVRRATGSPGTFRGIGRGEPLPGTRRPQPDAPAGDLAGHPYFWAPFVFIGPPR